MGEEITIKDVQMLYGGLLQIDFYFEEQKKFERAFCPASDFFYKLGDSIEKSRLDKYDDSLN